MKVVLFCGGLGMRLRESADSVPKPMVHIGYRPILWHVMKYYAHYGHKEFVLCLGYKADTLKSYFRHYDECLSNDFIFANGGRELQLVNRDIEDWRIAFVDTGTRSNIGQRLRAVAPYLDGEDIFLANYSDGLTDLPLPAFIRHFVASGKTAMFVCVRPTSSFHVVATQGEVVTDIRHVTQADIWINGGYFIFRRDIFKYLREGEELVEEPFLRLIRARELIAYRYDGFWTCMDTFKDKERLEDMYARGEAPWEVWKSPARATAVGRPGAPGLDGSAGGLAAAETTRAD